MASQNIQRLLQVIREQPSSANDANPEHQRQHSGEPRDKRRKGILVPLLSAAINGRVKDENIQSGEKDERDFHAEIIAGVALSRMSNEEKSASDEHDEETAQEVRPSLIKDFRYRPAAKKESRETKIEPHDHSNGNRQGENVCAL